MTARRSLALFAALPLVASCAVCEKVGCGAEGVQLTLYGRSIPDWEADAGTAYVLELDLDGTTVTCTGTAESGVACDDPAVAVWGFRAGTGDDAIDGLERIEIGLDPWPEVITLVVTADGAEVLSDTFVVEPVVSRPNGPGCEPECRAWIQPIDW